MSKYRVVPVIQLPPAAEEEQVDIRPYLYWIASKRVLLFKNIGWSLLLAMVLYFLSGKEYTTEVILLPEYATTGKETSSLIGEIGSLLGGGGSFDTYRGSSNALRVDLYPEIATSAIVLKDLMESSFYYKNPDTTATLYTYFSDLKNRSALDFMLDYTIKLPITLINTIKPYLYNPDVILRENLGQEGSIPYMLLSDQEQRVLDDLRTRITSDLDKNTYIISLSVTMPESELTARATQRILELMTTYITGYRTQKLREDINFLESEMIKTEQRYKKAQLAWADFKDENSKLITERSKIEETVLKSEYNLSFNLYRSLVQQLSVKRIQLQEETPIFKLLQPVEMPLYPSSPMLIKMVILVLIPAFIIQTIYLGFKDARQTGKWFTLD